ncbi:TRAP transporter substrate-binding protein DctP [Brucepastera parasyntrophica]|uniref:TRAP transporter substrate-binding protein DctP n=1 Tax=Brucepastera parasyntrophica TaxID=2880008 RepID=UPI00210E7F35|nr:TRAP transporter substrate-binding protein DctP [Brucepastera parasyntrophica]ULQ59515.1 TRAP transporter substrate-binding protein DctP [Brucepastera parasyntrophica]
MNMKKIVSITFFCSVLFFSVSAQAKVHLKIASVAPSRSPWDIEQRALAQEWAKITNGEVQITFYDANSLGGEKSVIQKFRSARPGQKAPLDGAILTTIGLYEVVPSASIYTFSIPFLIQNQKELNAVLDTVGPELEKEYEKNGFQMIAWTNVGWLSFYTKDKFSDLSELKKIKIASAGIDSPILGDAFRTAGFTIEDMQSAKVLQSLKSNGGVRGFFGVHMYAYVTGFSKAISYALDTKLCPVMAGFVISNESWAQVPDKYKPAMLEAVDKMRKRLDVSLDDADNYYIEKMEADGVTMIQPTAAELKQWEAEFDKDVENISKTIPGAVSVPLYHKIQETVKGLRN